VFNYRFFRASNLRVSASKSSSGGALYIGGGVDDFAVAADFPFASASSSVGGISGSLGVLRPPAEELVLLAFGMLSEISAFSSVDSLIRDVHRVVRNGR
jgi:hypothetical protein